MASAQAEALREFVHSIIYQNEKQNGNVCELVEHKIDHKRNVNNSNRKVSVKSISGFV